MDHSLEILAVGLVLLSILVVAFAAQVHRTQSKDLADAMRMLASKDYPTFAQSVALEKKEPPREPTVAEREIMAEQDAFARAEADPYSQG